MKALPTTLALTLLLLPLSGCGTTYRAGERSYSTLPPQTERDLRRAQALHARALEHLEAGDLDQAERLLKEALAADITFGPAHNNLGRVYFEQGQLYHAAWEFRYAIKTMPNQPEPRNNLALVLESAQKLDDAVSYYQEALALEPDNAEIIGNLARARLSRGDRGPEVRDLLEQLILKDPRPTWQAWARERLALLPKPPDKPTDPPESPTDW